MFVRTLFALVLASTLVQADPVLAVDRLRHRFGEVPPGTPVRTQFDLSNAGDGVLEVRRVVPTCECTTVTLAQRTLKAHEHATLEVVFDPAKDKGHIERSVLLVSNSAGKQRLELFYEAEVVHPVMASAEAVFFPETLRREHPVRTVDVRSHVDQDLALELRSSLPPWLSLSCSGQGRRARLRFTLDASRLPAEGGGNGTLLFATGVAQSPELSLEYYWTAGHAVLADPAGLAFDPAGTGKAQAYTVTLTHARGRRFRILGLKAEPGPFRVQRLNRGPGQRLRVSLGAEVPAGSYRGRVVVRLDDPDQNELIIPVAADLQ